jgi:hypothetical protein
MHLQPILTAAATVAAAAVVNGIVVSGPSMPWESESSATQCVTSQLAITDWQTRPGPSASTVTVIGASLVDASHTCAGARVEITAHGLGDPAVARVVVADTTAPQPVSFEPVVRSTFDPGQVTMRIWTF